ncbi:hypothetical protein EC843_101995 [Buttiauxella sp. JUb87]|uniref:hypothetical protein n=1 Tax=Buttiauxella sp. JUb87 TaxID=2485129 RepID=UPI0010EDBE06|nr:hypothetical protein [Buttiauxella sp. JUb87]TDN54936.1 hypothetical protein EC843_101995 [Buttiauxella sp. JUb87]
MTTSPLKVEEEQQRFEAACRDGLLNGGLAKFDDGGYVSSLTDSVWRGWKAGRASIVIDKYDFDTFSPHDCGIDAVWMTEVERTLRAAGITVKGDSDEANANAS